MIIVRTTLFLCTMSILGCASSTAIQQADITESGFQGAIYQGRTTVVSENTQNLPEYRVFQRGSTGFVELDTVRARAEGRANKFCDQRNMASRVIIEQASTPPHIIGNFPRVELIFVCEEASKSASSNRAEAFRQLETLANLLERGVITQAEFDKEKSRLLNSSE